MRRCWMGWLVLSFLLIPLAASTGGNQVALIFAAYVDDGNQLYHVRVLVESIRCFAGKFQTAPICIYAPEALLRKEAKLAAEMAALGVELKFGSVPQGDARNFFFAAKVFAAAQAEAEAEKRAEILAWMDEDTVLLKEPRHFNLAKETCLGYRPVMHQNIGSLYAEPIDPFWSRVYEKLSVPAAALFPMRGVADNKIIRPYFNAGLLVVRPERGILRRWAADFAILCQDPFFVAQAGQDTRKNVFLHQAALSGTILSLLGQQEMVELPRCYNLPIFFKEMYGAEREFNDLAGVVTLRYDVYFRNPAPNWSRKLKGPKKIIAWLEKRLPRATN